MKRTLQVFLALFGVTTILIGLLHVAIGPGAIPGSIPVNATMDSRTGSRGARATRFTVTNSVDGIIYALITGATFGWLWPH
jgi:hypothetical protein